MIKKTPVFKIKQNKKKNKSELQPILNEEQEINNKLHTQIKRPDGRIIDQYPFFRSKQEYTLEEVETRLNNLTPKKIILKKVLENENMIITRPKPWWKRLLKN